MIEPSIWSKLHGASTHFPIALMLVAALCDGMSYFSKDAGVRRSYRFVATVTIVLGVLGSYAAVLTGLVMTRGEIWGHATLLHHHQFVWPAFVLMTGLATWRIVSSPEPSRESATVYLVLMIASAALIGGAGYWGGELLVQG
jgi:uncharacterized membrane protein